MIEVELKYKANHEQVLQKLRELNATELHTEENIDMYYNSPLHNFRETDEALRIRKIDNINEITYKGPKFDNLSKTRIELNAKYTGDMPEILEKLGFNKVRNVCKIRTFYEINNVKICLDHVEELGEFIELEQIIEQGQEYETIIAEMKKLVRSLGLNPENQINVSYLELLERNAN